MAEAFRSGLINKRVVGVPPHTGAEQDRPVWNAQDWDVQ